MHKRSKTVRFSSCIQNKWTSILYLLLELIIGFGRSILWVQHIDHLLFVLFCSIIRWSVGHGLLRSEVAQVFFPHRNRQKPSFCLSHHGTVWLWQDLWDTLVFLVEAHEPLRWIVPPKIWYTDPHLSPCLMEKWYLVRFYRFSLHWQEWDLSLMDRVSWCKSCITRSEKLLTQGTTECFIFSSAAGIRSSCSCSSPPFYFF